MRDVTEEMRDRQTLLIIHASSLAVEYFFTAKQDGVSRESFHFFLEYIYFVKSGEDITESVATGLLDLAKYVPDVQQILPLILLRATNL